MAQDVLGSDLPLIDYRVGDSSHATRDVAACGGDYAPTAIFFAKLSSEVTPMLMAIQGVFKNGQIQLREKPRGVEEAPVVVTFLPVEDDQLQSQPLQYGKYSQGELSTEADLKSAEWHGEAEFEALTP